MDAEGSATSDIADRLHAALLAAFRALVPILPGSSMDDCEGYHVVSAPSFPVPSANAVWADDPNEATAIRELAAALAGVQARGVSPAVVVREGRTPGVEEEARRLGFDGVEAIPGMVATPESFRPTEGSGPELVRVGADEDLLHTALEVSARGFDAPPELFGPLFEHAMGAGPIDLWLAFVDGQAVSTAMGLVAGGAVGIFSVATPPEHRRKGYGARVTAQAVRRGFEAGAPFAYLQSSEMGLGVYERLGFEQVSTYLLLSRPDTPPEV